MTLPCRREKNEANRARTWRKRLTPSSLPPVAFPHWSRGGGHRPSKLRLGPQIVASLKFSHILLTHCGQLILRKITKSDATRSQILRIKCTKFDFCWGSTPDPAGGAYSAPPDPLAVFKGPTSKGRSGEELSLIHI